MASPLANWLLTFLMHSTVLGLASLVLARAFQAPLYRARILRFGLFCAPLTATLAPMLGTGPAMDPRAIESPQTVAAAPAPALAGESELKITPAGSAESPGDPATSSQPAGPDLPWRSLVVALWLVGAALSVGHMLLARRRWLHGLDRAPLGDPGAARMLTGLLGDKGSEPVEVTRSAHLAGPVVLSRREICVPTSTWSTLREDERRGLLAHEAGHIARRDPALFLAGHLIERAFFFQPLLRILRSLAHEEAERATDAWAIERLSSPVSLARCLSHVAESRAGLVRVPLSVAGAGSSPLVERIERILGSAPATTNRTRGIASTCVGVLGIAAVACTVPHVESKAMGKGPRLEYAIPTALRPDALVLDIDPGGEGRLAAEAGRTHRANYNLRSREERDRLKAELVALAGWEAPLGQGEIGDGPGDNLAKLRLRVHADAPFMHVQHIMEICGSYELQLWDLEFDTPGPENQVYRYALPSDVFGSGPDPTRRDLTVRMSLEGESKSLTYHLSEAVYFDGVAPEMEEEMGEVELAEVEIEEVEIEAEMEMEEEEESGASEAAGAPSSERTFATWEGLAEALRGRLLAFPGSKVTIDARSGVTHGAVLDVIDASLGAGVEDIRFVGSYAR